MKLRNKKTGELGKLHCDMNVNPTKYGVFEDTDIRGHYWEYDSLSELNEEWEDYEQEKPLIKDEKVRKAIMTWYEALPLDDLAEKRILFSNGDFCVGIYRIDCGNYVALKDIKERFYTIKELCGDDEE